MEGEGDCGCGSWRSSPRRNRPRCSDLGRRAGALRRSRCVTRHGRSRGRRWLSPTASARTSRSSRGRYITVDRQWRAGDTLQVRFPMSLHMEALPDDPHIQALMYGPVVLAGDLGTAGLEGVKRYGPSAPPLGRVRRSRCRPSSPTAAKVLARVQAGVGQAAHLRDERARQAERRHPHPALQDVRAALHGLLDDLQPGRVQERERRRRSPRGRAAKRSSIAARDRDVVNVTEDEASEQAHAYAGARARAKGSSRPAAGARRAQRVPELRAEEINPGPPTSRSSRTYRGGEGQRRVFDVLVEGTAIGSDTLEYHPAELLDREYQVPETLTRGEDEDHGQAAGEDRRKDRGRRRNAHDPAVALEHAYRRSDTGRPVK